ncbi:MAG TPA: hypothetical protein DEB06_03970 [Phycisphaerales bacterium]|nr:hypothetical protein [Phycisphaerales bacterium]
MKSSVAFVAAAVGAVSGSALGASVAASGFDQVARINALGGSVSQIGGGMNGKVLLTAADFVPGGSTALSGVSVSLAGWQFASSALLMDAAPTQVGNIAALAFGAPTDITFTAPGAGGPDATAGDGSLSLSASSPTSRDVLTLNFGAQKAAAGSATDAIIFTDTDGGGSFSLEVLLNGMVVDSVPGAVGATGGAFASALGGYIIDLPDGLMFDALRVTALSSFVEIDAAAVRVRIIPLPSAAGLATAGLLALAGARRRRGA